MGDSQPPQPSTSAEGAAAAPNRANAIPWVIAAVGLVVVVVLVAMFLSGGTKAHTLTGTVALVAPGDITGSGTSCKGKNEFSDFGPGLVVTVFDGSGEVIGKGKATNQSASDAPDDGTTAVRCVIEFRAEVDDAASYRVDVGKLATQSFDRSDLEADDWHVVLNLG
jgi:hypothetical protein